MPKDNRCLLYGLLSAEHSGSEFGTAGHALLDDEAGRKAHSSDSEDEKCESD